ncbi:MAG: hypothetical protein AAF050_10425 [Cyanobacteria bacterium J06649_5]
MTKASLLLSGFVLIGLASCNSKVSQCNQFADIINDSQSFKGEFEAEIENSMTQASGAQGLEDLQASAGEYTKAVDKVTEKIGVMVQNLEGIDISDEQLDEYRDTYVTVITGSRDALTSASSAMQLVAKAQTEDEFREIFDTFQTQANSAFSDLQGLSAQETTLIEQVNAYCGSEPE